MSDSVGLVPPTTSFLCLRAGYSALSSLPAVWIVTLGRRAVIYPGSDHSSGGSNESIEPQRSCPPALRHVTPPLNASASRYCQGRREVWMLYMGNRHTGHTTRAYPERRPRQSVVDAGGRNGNGRYGLWLSGWTSTGHLRELLSFPIIDFSLTVPIRICPVTFLFLCPCARDGSQRLSEVMASRFSTGVTAKERRRLNSEPGVGRRCASM